MMNLFYCYETNLVPYALNQLFFRFEKGAKKVVKMAKYPETLGKGI